MAIDRCVAPAMRWHLRTELYRVGLFARTGHACVFLWKVRRSAAAFDHRYRGRQPRSTSLLLPRLVRVEARPKGRARLSRRVEIGTDLYRPAGQDRLEPATRARADAPDPRKLSIARSRATTARAESHAADRLASDSRGPVEARSSGQGCTPIFGADQRGLGSSQSCQCAGNAPDVEDLEDRTITPSADIRI